MKEKKKSQKLFLVEGGKATKIKSLPKGARKIKTLYGIVDTLKEELIAFIKELKPRMPEAAVIEEIQEKLIPKIVKLENQQDLKAKIGFRMREWKEKDFNAMALANFICGALGEYYCDTGEFVEK